jgi:hypothetical protein
VSDDSYYPRHGGPFEAVLVDTITDEVSRVLSRAVHQPFTRANEEAMAESIRRRLSAEDVAPRFVINIPIDYSEPVD